MKKIFILVIIFLFMPFIVLAEEVKVKNITVEGLGESSYDEDNINLVSEFNDVNDTIKYIITLENLGKSDVDIKFDVPKNEYVKYTVDMADTIKKESTMDAIITVKYINNPTFHNNTYVINDSLGFSFKEKILNESNNVIEVPDTVDTKILTFMGILLISVSLYGIIIIKYKKGIKYSVILILPVVAMASYIIHSPVSYALKMYNINSKITIHSKDKYVIDDVIFKKDSNSNDKLDFGDVIKIDTENFYVLENSNDRVTALSMYNLHVGGDYDTVSKEYTVYMNPTYIQDENMTAILDGNNKKSGVMLYNESTLSSIYLKYKEHLSKTVAIENVRGLSEYDMTLMGCNSTTHSCSSAPLWTYSTSYFAYLYTNPTRVWEVADGGYFNVSKIDTTYSGVRAVIEFKLGAD